MKPYLYFVIAFAWIGSLTGVGSWQHGEGVKTERLDWQTRESKELREANHKITMLQEQARQKEADHAQALFNISLNYQKELNDANKQNKALTDAVRSGQLRLRDHNAACQSASGSDPGTVGPGTSGRDGRTGAYLSTEAAEFLLGLAGEADAVVLQLKACQAVVVQDRQLRE